MQKTKTFMMILCALFAALTAVLSQVALPIGPVPINLATFAVLCAGAVLGAKLGALSLVVWAVLGICGVPVFSMFRSGIGTLLGPTGGYIIGYIPAAFLVGLISEKINNGNKAYLYAAAMFVGAVTYFSTGTIWFMFSTETSLSEALSMCVIPFIPGDLIKIAIASIVSARLKSILELSQT